MRDVVAEGLSALLCDPPAPCPLSYNLSNESHDVILLTLGFLQSGGKSLYELQHLNFAQH